MDLQVAERLLGAAHNHKVVRRLHREVLDLLVILRREPVLVS
jgi:hypothetical protein